MKKLLLLFTISIHIFALDIYLNSAKENNLSYAVLHIIDNEPIKCRTISQALDKKSYICSFEKIIKNRLTAKKLDFVNIDFLEKNNKFYVNIEPKYNSKLLRVDEKLYDKKEVNGDRAVKKSKHWMVLLYKKLPFGKNLSKEGINFPITFDKYLKPYIGSVDLNGAPISYVKSRDINYYVDIEKEFQDKDYDVVIKDVDRALKQYPNSIFKSDLLLYKLKTIDICIEKNISPISDEYTNNDLLKLGKMWIREFSSNEGIPQVLLILVKGYLRVQSSSDVNYFLDILISEHKDSIYTKKAILYFADSLYSKNDKNRAMKLYEDVLYSANDLDIASLAAIKLVNSKINTGKTQEAKRYLVKVLNANKKFLLKDTEATSRLAVKLAANGLERIAANLNDLLLENLKKGEQDQRELLLKQAGDWYAKAGKVKKAYARYKEYKKDYKEGLYINEVNKAIDRLFFKIDENNETKLINYYDVLISKYNNDIKDKAIIEKAKLLMKQKKYKKIIKMKKLLTSFGDTNSSKNNNYIKEASIKLIDNYVQKKNCQKAINLYENNGIDFNDIDNKRYLFECFIITSRYKKAYNLAKAQSQSKNLNKKFLWLENMIISQNKLQNFDGVIKLKDDLFNLSAVVKKQISAPVYRAIINSLMFKKLYNQSLSILYKLEKLYPKDIKNLELYYRVINYANSKRDDLLLIKYAKKILKLQKGYKVNFYTPKVNFMYIDALKRLSRLQEAKKLAEELKNLKLEEKYNSRILYILGELNLKLKNDKKAKEYFMECSKEKSKDSWTSLCEESLKIF
ncbi:Paralysed flagella protein PflA [hydrothermal vent metagenome]|uniref:Paralysed flagella protein PflA n=1 Tax=hydrothermal vent metagenome TaxID=652676 RepID=A0A1W1C1B1_9ZZZZ